jgi:hypothetical protein
MNRKTICLSTIFFAFAILFSGSLLAQSTKQLYAVGVNMGQASFYASVAQDENNYDHMLSVRDLALESLKNAVTFIDTINNASPFLLDIDALKSLIENQTVSSNNKSYYNNILNPQLHDRIITLIDGFLEKLTQDPNMSDYEHAYTLGVQIAIAEEQAAAGEAARQIVYISLNSAKSAAQELDLDITPLNECLILSSGTAPMKDVYTKIVSLRSTYQSSL